MCPPAAEQGRRDESQGEEDVGLPSVLRLLRFQPEGSGPVFDAWARDRLLPAYCGRPGLERVYLGRRVEESDERCLAALWTAGNGPLGVGPPGAPLANVTPPGDVVPAEITVIQHLELPLAVCVATLDRAVPQVLRVYQGQVRAGELDVYAAEAERGTLADIAAGHGPLGLFLAMDPPDRFVTVSIWTAWDAIEAATGGNIRQPIATKNTHRLVRGTALHYEMLPDDRDPHARASGAA
jgi:hypothetical protein